MTGAVYLSSDNDRKLDDNFNIIYGHHMDNGAMFGDIDKFHEEAFFRSHTKGFLQTLSQNYRLEFFAFMVTDAYNDEIYGCAYNDKSANIRLLKYIQSNSRYISDSYKNADISSINKLVALSTCEDAATNGRIVLFANAVPGEAEVDAVVENTSPDLLTAIGHASRGESFAFLNLVCLVLTFITIFPILWIRTKFRQIPYAAKTAKALAGENERVSRDMKRFAYSAVAGLVLEITIGAISAAVFIRTENITKPMVISDGNTLVMLLLLVLTYVIDYICFRYRGEKPSAPKEDKDKIS